MDACDRGRSSPRDGADVAEITGQLADLAAVGWPDGMRVIVRYQAFTTDTPVGQLAHLEARHRAHARVDEGIRCGKDTGIDRFPSRLFQLNAVWLELALTAMDLLAWTQDLPHDGEEQPRYRPQRSDPPPHTQARRHTSRPQNLTCSAGS
jgi:hypothetical protein